MMASSTNDPMAIAIPPKLMVLSVKPNPLSASTATSSESGRAISEMSVTRPFIRKKKSMTTTNNAPSHSERPMLCIALSMNRD